MKGTVMYLLVQNPNELPLWGIRVLGRSNKDSQQIGRFGSGLKEAICLLMRLDVDFIVYSGTCRVDFAIQNVDGMDEICFKLSESRQNYSADVWHPLGLDPNFGQYDWKNHWQALREIFCNALDEDEEFLHHGLVEELSGVEGATRFYIKSMPQILKAYGELPNRILKLGNPVTLFRHNIGRILQKSDLGEKTQVYNRGVWVQATDKSLFDYDLYDIPLTESRTSDWFHVRHDATILVNNAPAEILSEVFKAFLLGQDEYFEAKLLHYTNEGIVQNTVEWRRAWDLTFGSDAYATLGTADLIERVRECGKTPVAVSTGFLSKCKVVGIPTHEDLLDVKDASEFEVYFEGSASFDVLWEKLILDGHISREVSKPKVCIANPKHFKKKDYIVRNGKLYVTYGTYGCVAGDMTLLCAIMDYVSGGNATDRLASIVLESLR